MVQFSGRYFYFYVPHVLHNLYDEANIREKKIYKTSHIMGLEYGCLSQAIYNIHSLRSFFIYNICIYKCVCTQFENVYIVCLLSKLLLLLENSNLVLKNVWFIFCKPFTWIYISFYFLYIFYCWLSILNILQKCILS